MFTAEELISAHSKVKSGADFPAYIKEIKNLGVSHYETYVSDGKINYHSVQNDTVNLPAKYATIEISDITNDVEFKTGLVEHQQGKTDFLTFIKMCANCGIQKWEISLVNMTCVYYNKSGNVVLEENIPVI